MSNEITVGTGGTVNAAGDLAGAALPEVWRRKSLLARYANSALYGFVLHADEEVKSFGQNVHIRKLPTVSVNNVGSGGSVTNQALSYTETIVQIDKWKEATIDVDDQAQAQALVDLLEDFSQQFGKAIGEQQDTDMFNLYSNLSYNVGDSTSQLNDDLILAAIQKLDDAKVPFANRRFFFAPVAKRMLMKLDKFTLSYATGKSEGGQVNGELSELYGTTASFTPLVPTNASARDNLLIHMEAFAAATQKNFRIEKLARTKKSTPISGDILYGVKTCRADHGCIIYTATA